MFVLDTNVLSAMMATRPAPDVAAWIARQREDSLFTTTISQAEILAGIAVLPEGRRRRDLDAAARAIFEEDFERRVLTFDGAAAAAYGDLFAARRRDGRPTAPLDLMIAAIVRANEASVVTRDQAGFDGCGIPVIDPWAAQD